MSDKDTAAFWAGESGKHLLTYTGPATGLFGFLGLWAWGSWATCEVAGPFCQESVEILGLTFTSAGQLGFAFALAAFVVSLAAWGLLSDRNG